MSKRIKVILGIEAIACIAISIIGIRFSENFVGLLAFPFEQIGMGIRALSSSGFIENILAVIIYILICLIPVIYGMIRLKKDRSKIEDWLLVLISGLLFVVIYMMINPVDIAKYFGNFSEIGLSKISLGVVVYSAIIGYIVMRVLRFFYSSRTEDFLKNLKTMLTVIMIIFVYTIFAGDLSAMLDDFSLVTYGEFSLSSFGATEFTFIMKYLVGIIPAVFILLITNKAFSFVNNMEDDIYSEKALNNIKDINRLCTAAIITIMLSQIFINIIQFMGGEAVMHSNYKLDLPIIPITLIIFVILLSQHFEKTKLMKEENDSII